MLTVPGGCEPARASLLGRFWLGLKAGASFLTTPAWTHSSLLPISVDLAKTVKTSTPRSLPISTKHHGNHNLEPQHLTRMIARTALLADKIQDGFDVHK